MNKRLQKYNLYIMTCLIGIGYLYFIILDTSIVSNMLRNLMAGCDNWYIPSMSSQNPILKMLYFNEFSILYIAIPILALLFVIGVLSVLLYRHKLKDRTLGLYLFAFSIPLATYIIYPVQLIACIGYFVALVVITARDLKKSAYFD